MPKEKVRSKSEEPADNYNSIKPASDQVALERACDLIDNYIREMWADEPTLVPGKAD
jgi:hypothetical protein